MSDLSFACLSARAERHAAVPTLMLRLRITEPDGNGVHTIALRCQIQIETQRRQYTPDEADRLIELFGDPTRWSTTLRPLHFASLSHMVPSFRESIEFDLPVPCTYDFEVAATKYFHALDSGEIPLLLLFSGTVFARRDSGFVVTQVPWHKEAAFRLPVSVWRDVMDHYFPNSTWIRLQRPTLDRLQEYKARQAMTSWDEAIGALLAMAPEGVKR